MSKSKMGFKLQTNPKCASQPPEDQDKFGFCCQFQWETQAKTFGRWFSHSRPYAEHLLRSTTLETPKTCHNLEL